MPAVLRKLVLGLAAAGLLCPHLKNAAPQKPPPSGLQSTSGPPVQNAGAPAAAVAWHLNGVEEPPLVVPPAGFEIEAYRLTWMGFPSGRGVILRLQILPDGTGQLFVRQVSMSSAGLLPAKDAQDLAVPAAGVNRFLELIGKANFWTLSYKVPEPLIFDGSDWILEGVHNQEYHAVSRHEPDGSFLTEIGRYLAEDLAHLPKTVISIPRWEPPVLVRRKQRDEPSANSRPD